jgi:hypothetical protein
MTKPDEDPPVTGGRDLPESLVWRPSEPNKLSERTAGVEALGRLRSAAGQAFEYRYGPPAFYQTLNSCCATLAAELAAKDEEIRRLREALDYAQSRLAAKVMDGD